MVLYTYSNMQVISSLKVSVAYPHMQILLHLDRIRPEFRPSFPPTGPQWVSAPPQAYRSK